MIQDILLVVLEDAARPASPGVRAVAGAVSEPEHTG